MVSQKLMLLAVKAARQGVRQGQGPFGAVIVKKGKVLAVAHNTVVSSKDSTCHAEVNAIRATCKKLKTFDLSGCEIYSTCEPCPMCFSSIYWAKIKKIIYGAGIADAASVGFKELTVSNAQLNRLGRAGMKIKKGLLRKECVGLMREWAANPKRVIY